MSLFVLDTDMVSLLQHAHPRVVARSATVSREKLAITVVTVEEQLTGWYSLVRKTRKPDDLVRAYQSLIDSLVFLARLPILPLTHAAVEGFEQLVGLKLNVGRMDLRIAAIVSEHKGILVTRNVRDFGRVPGLSLEDWTRLTIRRQENSPRGGFLGSQVKNLVPGALTGHGGSDTLLLSCVMCEVW